MTNPNYLTNIPIYAILTVPIERSFNMEPTTAELIFWILAIIVGVPLIVRGMATPCDSMDITWGQRRDWARREKEWR